MADWREEEDERLKSYFNTYVNKLLGDYIINIIKRYKDSTSAIDLVVASMGAQRMAAEVYLHLSTIFIIILYHLLSVYFDQNLYTNG